MAGLPDLFSRRCLLCATAFVTSPGKEEVTKCPSCGAEALTEPERVSVSLKASIGRAVALPTTDSEAREQAETLGMQEGRGQLRLLDSALRDWKNRAPFSQDPEVWRGVERKVKALEERARRENWDMSPPPSKAPWSPCCCGDQVVMGCPACKGTGVRDGSPCPSLFCGGRGWVCEKRCTLIMHRLDKARGE